MPSFQVKKISNPEVEVIEAVSKLHIASFYKGWSASDIFAVLSSSEKCELLVAETEGVINGFIIIRMVADEAEIITIAVHSKSRRMGIGKALIEKSLALTKTSNIKKVFLEVDVEYAGAVKLYEKAGFKKIATRKNYYERANGFSDALVMELAI